MAVPLKVRRYMTRFTCIGPTCEDTCCQAWKIPLNKQEYATLQSLYATPREQRERFAKGVARVSEEHRSETNYAYFRLNQESTCTYLEEGICAIHRDHGPSKLPTVCDTFPRRLLEKESHMELCGGLSCPEVARLCLLAPDAMDLLPQKADELPARLASFAPSQDQASPYEQHRESVNALIQKLQDKPGFSSEQKIYSLLYFSSKIDRFYGRTIQKDPQPRLGKMIDRMQQDDHLRQISRNLERPPGSSKLALAFLFAGLTATYIKKSHARFNLLSSQALATYGTLATGLANPLHEIWERYLKRKATILADHSDRVEQYLNRFSAYYFQQNFYWESERLLLYVRDLILFRAVVSFLFYSHPNLQELSNQRQEQANKSLDQTLVAVVQSFMRYVAQDPEVLKVLRKSMTEQGFEKLGDLTPLLLV